MHKKLLKCGVKMVTICVTSPDAALMPSAQLCSQGGSAWPRSRPLSQLKAGIIYLNENLKST